MIPYQELAAALEQWRVRTGLPTHAAMPVAAPRPVVAATPPPPTPMAPIAVAPPARVTPPAPPPGRSTMYGVPPPPAVVAAAARPPTNLPVDELDAEVLDEDHVYDNEGNDFAVSFSGPPAAASGSIGHDGDGSTLAAVTAPVPALDDPFDSETAAVRADVWPEVAEAREWPAEQTNATAYGWGQGLRPVEPGPDDDEGGSTVVGSTKPRT